MLRSIKTSIMLILIIFLAMGTTQAHGPIGLGSITVNTDLHVYSQSSNMEHIGFIPVPTATGIETQGRYLYVGIIDEGMRIYDISNPAEPKETGRYIGPGYQNDVAVSGKIALLATDPPDADPGFDIIDISDPTSPTKIGEYKDRRAHAITLVKNLAFPSGTRNMDIIDISDPKAPKIIGTFTAHAVIHDVQILNDRVYLATGRGKGVQIVDISDPTNPYEVSSLTDPETDYSHETIPSSTGKLVVMSDETFETSSAGGELTFIDTSDEKTPRIMSKFFVDVTGYPPGLYSAHNFQIDGDKIITAWYSAGTRVIDISDPANPVEIGHYVPEGALTWEALTHSGYIYTGDTTRGIDILKFHPEISNKK